VELLGVPFDDVVATRRPRHSSKEASRLFDLLIVDFDTGHVQFWKMSQENFGLGAHTCAYLDESPASTKRQTIVNRGLQEPRLPMQRSRSHAL
jgi:hypothetical protein